MPRPAIKKQVRCFALTDEISKTSLPFSSALPQPPRRLKSLGQSSREIKNHREIRGERPPQQEPKKKNQKAFLQP